MALKKEITTETGVVASYWRLEIINLTKHGDRATLGIGLYYEPNAAEPIFDRNIEVESDIFDKYFRKDIENYPNIYAVGYAVIKEADEFFADAEDC